MTHLLSPHIISLTKCYTCKPLAKVGNIKDKDIPKIVKKLRTELGLTQEQFAAKVGVTFSTVNRWENNKGEPSPLAMKQIIDLRKKVTKKLPNKTGDQK